MDNTPEGYYDDESCRKNVTEGKHVLFSSQVCDLMTRGYDCLAEY